MRCRCRLRRNKSPATEELAKKTQNPVADLISVPLQNNFNFGAGVNHNKMIYALNVQPVIPIKLTDEWNLITRTIMPIINQPSLFPTAGGAVHSTTGTGLGDINPTVFLSPAKSGELIWGLGPTMTLPTATDRDLGSGQWSMGPAGVVLTIQGHWVYGALMNNQWSVAGWGDKPVNAMLLQWFVNYNLPDGWYLTSCANSHGGLESRQSGRCVDGAAWRRRRQIVQTRRKSCRSKAIRLRSFRLTPN